VGARADHAEVKEPAAARDGGVTAREVSGVEQLGVTAGNAAVSRLLAGARSAPLPPSAPTPPPDLHHVPPRREGRRLTPLQRLVAAPSVVPAVPAPSIGIVPAPAVQRAAPTEVLDAEAASSEVQARRPGQVDDRSAGRTELEGSQTTSADELAGESDGADRPASGEVGSPTVSRLARPAAPAGSTMPAGALSTSPTAVDVHVAPARGPPGSAVQTSGSEAPAHRGWATESSRTSIGSLAEAEATDAPAVETIPQNGPGATVEFSAATDQDGHVISGTGAPVGGSPHATTGPVEVERLAIAGASPTMTAAAPVVASDADRRRRGAEASQAGDAPVEHRSEAAATAVQRWSWVLQRGGGRPRTRPAHDATAPAGAGPGSQGPGTDGFAGAAAGAVASHRVSVQRKAGSYAPPAPPVRRNPRSDPRFKKVSGELKKTKKEVRAHPPGKGEAKKAADAAVPPANDKQAKAKTGQVDKMAGAKKGGFDKAAFIAAVKQAIAAAAPKTLEEADKFADSGKAAGVKGQVMGKVATGKEESARDVAAKTKEAPDASKASDKEVKPLEPAKETKPKTPEFAKAMPAKVPPEQTDFAGPKNEVNDKMAEADVSESDLKKSNEPQMMEAAAAKKEGEVLAAKAPKDIRSKEANVLKKAEADAAQKGKGGVDAMVGAKKNALAQAGAKKTDQKSKDEAKRAQIAGELNKIFDKTKTDVEKILTELDGKVDQAFTKGEADVRKAFTAEHKRELEAFKDRRYSGIDGKIQWGIDLFKDLSEVREVKQIYERARGNYEKGMERVISNVADVVGREIDRAKDRITAGRLEIKDWVTKQPQDIQKLAADAAKGMDEKFNQLESDVDAKSQSLAEDLAGKYTAALSEVNKEIEEAQAANKSAWSKAKAAIGDAIEAILKLKDLFMGMLAKAAGAFKKIIADPLKFIGNFLSAVKAGFLGFADRIGEHLKKGLQGWLFGKLAEAGIEIPDKLDLQGIIRMVLSILGLTWGAIRPKIVKVVGEKAMSFLETKAEVFMILVKEGVGGLWKWIVDKVGDLKEMVMGQIRDFVITKIVKAGITWVIGMLNPAGALIKIIQTLISVVQWIMERGAALVELVGSIIDAVSDIANGGMGGVPAKIEGALSRAVPIVISFLASLLGLGGIGDKIKSILDSVRGPVGKAVDAVIGGAVKAAKGLIAGAKGLGAKAKAKVLGGDDSPEGKQRRLDAAISAAVPAVDRFAGKPVGKGVLVPILGAIRIRYGLTSLRPIEEDGNWTILGEINPSKKSRTAAKAASGGTDEAAGKKREVPFVMRFQVQWDTGKGGPTFSTTATAQAEPGITASAAVASLTAAVSSVVPKAAQNAAAPALAKQSKWISARPPGGIGTEGYSKSEYFSYGRTTDARVDVENIFGHNLRT